MLHYDKGTEKLIKKLGNDAPLHFKESFTGVEFEASNHQLLIANCDMNYLLRKDGAVTLEQFLAEFEIPIDIVQAVPKDDLKCGWNWACFEVNGWDVDWVTFFISCNDSYGELIFDISYYDTPCIGCNKCNADGSDCERYQSYVSDQYYKYL